MISLASTVVLKAGHCIQAKKTGISEDEIVQTILISGIITGNTMFHTAYESFSEPLKP